MHAAALRYAGLVGEYRLIDVEPEQLSGCVREMREEGFRGFNVTIPHKQAIHAMCGELTQAAYVAGAVNTVLFADNEILNGHNTDIGGFRSALISVWERKPIKYALILGAGGAARAALMALIEIGVRKIYIAARDALKSSILANDFYGNADVCSASFDELPQVDWLSAADLIVNCTPIGQKDPHIPNSIVTLVQNSKKSTFLFDMVYARDGKTPLVELARENGLSSCDGLDMLVNQAALAFEYWTGKSVPPHVMKEAILK